LVLAGRRLGALRFSFSSSRLFDESERQFVLALAAQTAQSVDRSALHVVEAAARKQAETALGRLARLHEVTASLATASSVEEITDIVARMSGQTLGANVSALCTLEDDGTLRVVGFHGMRRRSVQEQWSTFPVAADLPASDAVRGNVPVIAHSREEIETRWPLLAGQVAAEGSLACVPISVGDRCHGALSLSFPAEHVIDDDEMGLLAAIGQQCGLALERARLIADEREARQRSAFLSDATALLTSSLEPEETIEHLVSLVVPAMADWAVVYIADQHGNVVAATARHRDPAVGEWLVQMQRGQALDVEGGMGDILRTGRSLRYAQVPDELRARTREDLPTPELVAAIDPHTALGVPLTARGQVIGVIAMARTTDEQPYTLEEQLLVEDIAARAAVAVDHSNQFRRERDAALTLQRSLLPQRLPHLPGVTFAWRYLPGAAGTYIGGDWYDVLPLDGGRVALVIGDVMGRGLRAAAVMGQLRATARAHASSELRPSEILARLDVAVGGLEQDQITTALFAVLDPATRSLTVASAGHLPPLVTTADDAYFLDVEPGPPLGAGGSGYPELRLQLPDNATLLLFTDGLVEDRALPVDAGLETLRAALVGVTGAEALCNLALVALGRDTEHDDDTAMLAVELRSD
jgi:serine phosphatase RsbU (regulator of sigma subunit)